MNYQRRSRGVQKARRIINVWRRGYNPVGLEYIYDEDYIMFKRLIKTRKPCSCCACGNPRRHFGLKSRQELMAEESLTTWAIENGFTLNHGKFIGRLRSVDTGSANYQSRVDVILNCR